MFLGVRAAHRPVELVFLLVGGWGGDVKNRVLQRHLKNHTYLLFGYIHADTKQDPYMCFRDVAVCACAPAGTLCESGPPQGLPAGASGLESRIL